MPAVSAAAMPAVASRLRVLATALLTLFLLVPGALHAAAGARPGRPAPSSPRAIRR